MKARLTFTPHQRIVSAAKRHKGLYLSAEEIQLLSFDDAIMVRAGNDDEDAERAMAARAAKEPTDE